ncbi:trifunctional purine biosynthetic protein adenosine-3-like [Anneissia japonica]|uniref:trifunctional purine biosynthetic protein adenosine-3-like n=1 Tax=Anneissia japonica TaxID=1529436 RepID=UPI0014256956|nr:trifunctional purine biosynthetic protein adenosine-3-like [Anneissia japonica]XP_033124050.1 trifunctional purine biosynthetic protein adenosine-3-like [Anneissia japonica]
MGDKVLLLGSGGREHAISWKLSKSENVSEVLVAPGNAGTGNLAKISNAGPGVPVSDYPKLAKWCKDNNVSLVAVGPEAPLAAGITDALSQAGIACFGPSKSAAEIESSKEFAKGFMDRHGIPTARWKSFTNPEEACQHINSASYNALVVKASGLAAGKGVVVANSKDEACQAVKDMMQDKVFGTAGDTVVVEELLEGEECSVLAFTDGKSVVAMPPAQDHKRLLEGDKGPNTGGMGAYCPCPQVSATCLQKINEQVLKKTVDGMREEGRQYVGVLYAGIMLTKDGPKVLEFNCRFGDPETQVLMVMLKSDLYPIMKACVNGNLTSDLVSFHSNQSAVAIVIASGGYPASYKKGMEIKGIQRAEKELGQIVFHAGTTRKDDKIVTSGGRVLATVAMAADLPSAASKALEGAGVIEFDGAIFRRDIAKKGCDFLGRSKSSGLTYAECGVSITAGNSLVDAIKPLALGTSRVGCSSVLGGFGGVFDTKAAGYKDPLLISGTDGVGTKLKIAQGVGEHSSVGIDLVAMCVNDILAHGAEALFFLDYFACGQLDVAVARDVVSGVAEGCRQGGCALLGGETAEMPGMYSNGEYDLAGFAVGAVERDQTMPRIADIQADDVIVGIASSGIHSNGFSLVRRLVEKMGLSYNDPCPFEAGKTLGQCLLTPTKVYSKTLLPSIRSGKVKAFAHITGGGLTENIPRVLPKHLCAHLNAKWNIPPVFGWIAAAANVSEAEMAKTFNCGIGGVFIVKESDAEEVMQMVRENGEACWTVGNISLTGANGEQVIIDGLQEALLQTTPKNGIMSSTNSPSNKMKVGVLISGTGTNLQALINHTKNPLKPSQAEIVLVISNVPDVLGLERAKKAGIPTKIISHKNYKKRVDFDMVVNESLKEAGVEVVCLAGFMRILSGEFVRKWQGHLINIHPSLLPSFKGMHAHKLALEAGVRISGCTVHFVEEEVDAGAILVQKTVKVMPTDTVSSLQERVKTAEHIAYPTALELVARKIAVLGSDGRIKWNGDPDDL